MLRNEDKTTDAYLASIKRYDSPTSNIERQNIGWVERLKKNKGIHSFLPKTTLVRSFFSWLYQS
jgi:hypothetical protein